MNIQGEYPWWRPIGEDCGHESLSCNGRPGKGRPSPLHRLLEVGEFLPLHLVLYLEIAPLMLPLSDCLTQVGGLWLGELSLS